MSELGFLRIFARFAFFLVLYFLNNFSFHERGRGGGLSVDPKYLQGILSLATKPD